MKSFLKSLPLIGPLMTHVRTWWRNKLTRKLRTILRDQKDLYIVQIGSNDGITGDPVHLLLRSNPSWKALLVEPVPFLFESLCKNYSASPNMTFANVAISEEAGTANFYYVDPVAKQYIPELPSLFNQWGSFDPGHIVRHFGNALDRFIVCTKVLTLPLATLLAQHYVTKIDLLHIDTEGHDWIVLRQLDLRSFNPEVILFEHKHLSDEDKRKALLFLKRDYTIMRYKYDFLCRRKQEGASAYHLPTA
jgi:FkbM family methyltransferase